MSSAPRARSGRYRFKADLEQLKNNQDSLGAVTQEWEKQLDFFCDITPKRADERFQFQHTSGVVTHDIETRWRSEFAPDKRVKARGRVFNIRGVINQQERDHVVVLECEEVVGE